MLHRDIDSHRENIFHTCCHVLGKLCSIIIDGGNNVNVASMRLYPLKLHISSLDDLDNMTMK
ncbi:hypothetical protein CR513_40422, partial [Mucuna pruriens]